MKVYYDTEFLDDGRLLDLISIGMVRDDGKEYYAVNLNLPMTRVLHHEWLAENVVPHLPTVNDIWLNHAHPDVKPHHEIKNEVEEFLLEASLDSAWPLELWSWYSAYDHVALAQLWGPMSKMPSFVPMYTNDIKQEFRRCGDPTPPKQDGTEHNALADAHYHKKLYEFIWQMQKDIFDDEVRHALGG